MQSLIFYGYAPPFSVMLAAVNPAPSALCSSAQNKQQQRKGKIIILENKS
jgi:hypothetical protein